jgi:hypothetical protein
MLADAANPQRAAAIARAPVVVTADARACTSQFDLLGTGRVSAACDVARSALAKAGIPYVLRDTAQDRVRVTIGAVSVVVNDGRGLDAAGLAAAKSAFAGTLGTALKSQGYPGKASAGSIDRARVVLILVVMMIYATMCYGPIAAALCELFPTRLRYTSVSLPYNLATGVIGGFLPASAFAIVAATGDPQSGLWYPISFIAITVLIGGLFWKDRHGHLLASQD